MRTSKRRDEIEQLLERRDREGLTYAEIARMAGIRPSTMATWAWQIRREGRRRHRGRARDSHRSFVEIVARGGQPDATRIDIELSNGRRISAPASIERDHLAHIVQALESC